MSSSDQPLHIMVNNGDFSSEKTDPEGYEKWNLGRNREKRPQATSIALKGSEIRDSESENDSSLVEFMERAMKKTRKNKTSEYLQEDITKGEIDDCHELLSLESVSKRLNKIRNIQIVASESVPKTLVFMEGVKSDVKSEVECEEISQENTQTKGDKMRNDVESFKGMSVVSECIVGSRVVEEADVTKLGTVCVDVQGGVKVSLTQHPLSNQSNNSTIESNTTSVQDFHEKHSQKAISVVDLRNESDLESGAVFSGAHLSIDSGLDPDSVERFGGRNNLISSKEPNQISTELLHEGMNRLRSMSLCVVGGLGTRDQLIKLTNSYVDPRVKLQEESVNLDLSSLFQKSEKKVLYSEPKLSCIYHNLNHLKVSDQSNQIISVFMVRTARGKNASTKETNVGKTSAVNTIGRGRTRQVMTTAGAAVGPDDQKTVYPHTEAAPNDVNKVLVLLGRFGFSCWFNCMLR